MTSALRLAYISSMATGGLAGFNYRELREMKRLGVDVSLFITKYKSGPYMPEGMPVHKIKPVSLILKQPLFLFTLWGIYTKLFMEAIQTKTVINFMIALTWAKEMKRSRCNWIHCHWGDHKLYIGYYCHKLTNLPLSVTIHGYDLYNNPNLVMFQKSLRACSQIITISDYNKKLLIDRYGELCEKTKVIRLSADAPSDSLEQIKRVLIVGGFQERKGYDILMEALHILNRKDIHLWVVGYKGPVDVQKLVNDFQLQDRVTIFGAVSDDVIRVLYTFCDIFCMPSRFPTNDDVGEGLPVALMEAMSYEKPIISTYHTGIPELVPDLLVNENDVQGLADAIGQLADNPELRKSMGKRNRKIVEKDYSDTNVKTLVDAFKIN